MSYTYYSQQEVPSLAVFKQMRDKNPNVIYLVHRDGVYLGTTKIASYETGSSTEGGSSGVSDLNFEVYDKVLYLVKE